MNFQQLRSISELTRQNFSLTEVAHALQSSQPGISRQIHDFEQEMGIDVFERKGKRITGLSVPGQAILRIVERLLALADQLGQASADYDSDTHGKLTIAATHTQARYALLPVLAAFRGDFPEVRIALRQGTPEHIATALLNGDADIGIATDGLCNYPDLITFPCARWHHLLVVPPGHPLLACVKPTLRDMADYPLITYSRGATGRNHIDAAFAAAGLRPDMCMTAMDADVIKHYAELGMGVGLVASIAFDAQRDTGLRAIDASHLFTPNTTRLALRRGAHLRRFGYAFIERFAPELTRALISQQLADDAAAAAGAA